MRHKQMVFVAVAIVASSSCESPDSTSEIEQLRTQVSELSSRIDSLGKAHSEFELRTNLKSVIEEGRKAAVLDPAADQGFHVVQSTYGPLTLRAVDVQPLADGSRLVLDVGNLTAATIEGGMLQAVYGRRRATDEEYEGWRMQLRQADLSFSTSLRSGYWNRINVTLAGVPPSDLGYVRLEVTDLPEISLSRPR